MARLDDPNCRNRKKYKSHLGFIRRLHQRVHGWYKQSTCKIVTISHYCFHFHHTNAVPVTLYSRVSTFIGLWILKLSFSTVKMSLTMSILARSCLLITLIKCLKGHNSLGLLSGRDFINGNRLTKGQKDGQCNLLSCLGTARNEKIMMPVCFVPVLGFFIKNVVPCSREAR